MNEEKADALEPEADFWGCRFWVKKMFTLEPNDTRTPEVYAPLAINVFFSVFSFVFVG